ncbi:EF-hand, partial [Decorospora gaudefroyi]
LGEYDVSGTRVLLDPHNLVTPDELRDIILASEPDVSSNNVSTRVMRVYEEFLARLLNQLSPDRQLSPLEATTVQGVLQRRYPENLAVGPSAVARAVARHAQISTPGHGTIPEGVGSAAPTEISMSDDDQEDETIDPEGQTLQRTLYHIAEDRARLEGVLHRGITCNGCDEKPIRGTRWHCANCVDFDLCSSCEATNSHCKHHVFYKIRVPAPYLALPKQEPLYPGKPHMMRPSINSALKKRLVRETRMETEEIEALWDQFTCLAGTEWTGDTTGVGWAIDRREFNHAFIPRYNSFVAAPNLVYDRIFAYYDTDKNGLIGFDEWVKGLDGMHTTDADVKARIVFNGYDVDGDGYISRKDVLRIFRAYYAIEKEATRNHVSELSDEVTVRNALDTIRSSQPLGSAFPPRNMAISRVNHRSLQAKQENDSTSEPIFEEDTDVAEREEIFMQTDIGQSEFGVDVDEQDARALANRWARRQFYTDEEEGMTRPEGLETSIPEDQDTVHGVHQTAGVATTNEDRAHNRGSRSSSRVRFQDEVDMETRSDASSSRPVGERWGGYEIPEPEKDLGKEVLYQITQQSFNELLDPLFLEQEDMAMDAHETRSERRRLATDIEATTMDLFTTHKNDIEAIVQVGIFRFSKCLVKEFCATLHHEPSTFQSLFRNPSNNGYRTEEEARTAIEGLYKSIEALVLRSVKISRTTNVDNTTMWNTLLCKRQLQKEVVDAVTECASTNGWLSTPTLGGSPVVGACRDPTMPQFRPNSLADAGLPTTQTSPNALTKASGSADADQSSVIADREDYSTRYFFIVADQADQDHDIIARDWLTKETGLSAPVPTSTPTASIDLSRECAPSIEPSPEPLHTKPESMPTYAYWAHWRSYTDSPVIHRLHISHVEGVDTIQYDSDPIDQAEIAYAWVPELDEGINPVKSLHRRIRQLALHPQSPLHLIMLASLETIEQEIRKRKGSGLIGFEEFLEHVKTGQFRFLESWMEWVSM